MKIQAVLAASLIGGLLAVATPDVAEAKFRSSSFSKSSSFSSSSSSIATPLVVGAVAGAVAGAAMANGSDSQQQAPAVASTTVAGALGGGYTLLICRTSYGEYGRKCEVGDRLHDVTLGEYVALNGFNSFKILKIDVMENHLVYHLAVRNK